MIALLPIVLLALSTTIHAQHRDDTVVSQHYSHYRKPNPKCEPITMPLCADLEYDMTLYPNLLNHETQVRRASFCNWSDFGCSTC